MKQFLTVLKFELNNYFKNKSFIITTVVFAILLAGVVIVPTFIPGLLGGKDTVEEQEEEKIWTLLEFMQQQMKSKIWIVCFYVRLLNGRYTKMRLPSKKQ